MNFIEKGVTWFNKQMLLNCVEPITIESAGVTKPVMAAIVAPDSDVVGNGLKVSTDKYIFLINRKQLLDVDIKRGIRFTRQSGEIYEAVIDKKLLKEFNDPYNTTRAIAAKLRI